MVFAVVLAVAVPDQGSTGWEPDFIRHCEPTGRRKAPPDDRLREAIHSCEESVDCSHGEWVCQGGAVTFLFDCGHLFVPTAGCAG